MKLREKVFGVFIALVYLMGQWGCATGPYGYPKPEPLSEEYREQLGTIGVATGPDVPDIEFDTPVTTPTPGVLARMGQGASEGYGKSGQWWLDNVLQPVRSGGDAMMIMPPLGTIAYWAVYLTSHILTVPVAIFGGLGGGIGGAFTPADEPPGTAYTEYVKENEAHLRDSLGEYPLQETFQSSFLKEARVRTSHTFVRVPEEGPQSDEGMVGQGVDTVLELSVQRIWLKQVDDQEPELNPPMVLVLFVRARLLRGPEKTVWYDQTFVQETKKRPYKEWPYHYNFQTAIEKAYHNLAEHLVNKLFFKTQTSQQ